MNLNNKKNPDGKIFEKINMDLPSTSSDLPDLGNQSS